MKKGEEKMGLFDDISRKVTDAGQKTMQKTKEMTDVARINSLISQEENKINNTYYQIGKMYVSLHANDSEEAFSGMVATVAELEQKISGYKKQIQDIKGVQHCQNCGAEVPRGFAFCSSCGSPMPKMQDQKNSDEYMTCMNCGASVKKGMKFCTSCGKPMQSMTVNENPESSFEIKEKICPNCGTVQSGDSVFCSECGAKL